MSATNLLISELTEPPIVGQFYRVPAIFTDRGEDDRSTWWPIIGPEHEDKEFLNFDRLHFHIDVRFLTDRQANKRGRSGLSASRRCPGGVCARRE